MIRHGATSPRLTSAIHYWRVEWMRTKPDANGQFTISSPRERLGSPEAKCAKGVPDHCVNLKNDAFEYHTASTYRNCCTCDIVTEYWNKPLELIEEGEIFDDDQSLVSTSWRLTGPLYTECDFTLRNTFGKLFVKAREIHRKYQTLSIDQLTYCEAQDRMTSDFVEGALSWFKFPHTYLVDMLNFFNRPCASLHYKQSGNNVCYDNVDMNLLDGIRYNLEECPNHPILESLSTFHNSGHWYLHKRCYCDQMCFEQTFTKS